MPGDLAVKWRDALGGAERLALTPENVALFAGLIDGLSVPDLRPVPELGSVLVDRGSGLYIEFDGYLVPEDAPNISAKAGILHRQLDTGQGAARHVNLELGERWRGERRSARGLCRNVELYRALGIFDVYLDATEGGSYLWARCGFDFNGDDARDEVVAAAAELLELLGFDEDLNWIRHSWDFFRIRGTTTVRDIAQAYGQGYENALGQLEGLSGSENPDEQIPLGKALLRASQHGGWAGHLDLRPQSDGLVHLLSYARGNGFT